MSGKICRNIIGGARFTLWDASDIELKAYYEVVGTGHDRISGSIVSDKMLLYHNRAFGLARNMVILLK